jgi:hypothetical protein
MQPGNGGLDMPKKLTNMEGWMLRHFWSRFSRVRGWQEDDVSWPAPKHCDNLETEFKREVQSREPTSLAQECRHLG